MEAAGGTAHRLERAPPGEKKEPGVTAPRELNLACLLAYRFAEKRTVQVGVTVEIGQLTTGQQILPCGDQQRLGLSHLAVTVWITQY